MKFEKELFPVAKRDGYTDTASGEKHYHAVALQVEGYTFDYCTANAQIVKLGIYHAKPTAIASDLWYVVDLDCGYAVASGKTRKAAYDAFVNGSASKWERYISSEKSRKDYEKLCSDFLDAIERCF